MTSLILGSSSVRIDDMICSESIWLGGFFLISAMLVATWTSIDDLHSSRVLFTAASALESVVDNLSDIAVSISASLVDILLSLDFI